MMQFFPYNNGQLYAEDLAVADLAKRYGTPLYVYSRASFTAKFQAFTEAMQGYPHLICYAVKANSNLAVLNLLARLGAGFDIVSQGELERVLAAGGDPAKVVFSGVGKQVSEINRALEVGIKCFNVESKAELERLNELAGLQGVKAAVSLRVNPDVDPQTHPYISTGLKANKFGIAYEEALATYELAASLPHIQITGLDCHIGSQITQLSPFLDALDRVLLLVDELEKLDIQLDHLDLGGGLGVRYNDETPPSPQEYVSALVAKLSQRNLKLILEPGRALAANSGILVTRVEYLKESSAKNFALVDAGMNDLLRPALYDAWQAIVPVQEHSNAPLTTWEVVGPVCETGDFLGKERQLSLQAGDLLAVASAGAYGFSMASNYNSRNKPAEVLVDGKQSFIVRARETFAEQFAGEQVLPE